MVCVDVREDTCVDSICVEYVLGSELSKERSLVLERFHGNMARSLKKGPYIDEKLLLKVGKQKKEGSSDPIKTWARACQIPPDFVGHRFAVHNGNKFIEVYVSETMVGHRLGEFSPTRTFRGHGKVTKRTMDKT